MDSLLNQSRPPAFCPGCSHEPVVRALDKALICLGRAGSQIALVSDIGCSGLFDTFFNTHALHGLHGRALTYATGIKLARPELTVVVTMGDGGLGIGGAHVLSACRRNLDLTLLVLNNFNYGMTGGQYSATTPADAQVDSGFLNRLEQPLDIGHLAGAAGAGFTARISAYAENLSAVMAAAISHPGFSVLDIRGICTGRYTRRNKITPKSIAADLAALPSLDIFSANKQRSEYGAAYRSQAALQKPISSPRPVPATHHAPERGRREALFLGSAGQHIVTAGEILCLAGASAGLHTVQKNDYPITVMRGHSIGEVVFSETPVGFTGIEMPCVVAALGQEGVNRRRKIFDSLTGDAVVLAAADVNVPACKAVVNTIDFKALKLKPSDWSLAALAWLALRNRMLDVNMLLTALKLKFKDVALEEALLVVDAVKSGLDSNFGRAAIGRSQDPPLHRTDEDL